MQNSNSKAKRYIVTIANSKFESLGDGINTVAGPDAEMLLAESQSWTPDGCCKLEEMEQGISP